MPQLTARTERQLRRRAICRQLPAFRERATGESDGRFCGEKAKCKRLQKTLDTAYCIYYIRRQFGVVCIRVADSVSASGQGRGYVTRWNPVYSQELRSRSVPAAI